MWTIHRELIAALREELCLFERPCYSLDRRVPGLRTRVESGTCETYSPAACAACQVGALAVAHFLAEVVPHTCHGPICSQARVELWVEYLHTFLDGLEDIVGSKIFLRAKDRKEKSRDFVRKVIRLFSIVSIY